MSTLGASTCPFTDPQRLFEDLAARPRRRRPALRRGVRCPGGQPLRRDRRRRCTTRTPSPRRRPCRRCRPPCRELFAGRVPSRGTLLGLDNPDHDRLRAAVNTFFMPRRLARYEPWIRRAGPPAGRRLRRAGAGPTSRRPSACRCRCGSIAHVVGLDADRADWIGAALGFFLGPARHPPPGHAGGEGAAAARPARPRAGGDGRAQARPARRPDQPRVGRARLRRRRDDRLRDAVAVPRADARRARDVVEPDLHRAVAPAGRPGARTRRRSATTPAGRPRWRSCSASSRRSPA